MNTNEADVIVDEVDVQKVLDKAQDDENPKENVSKDNQDLYKSIPQVDELKTKDFGVKEKHIVVENPKFQNKLGLIMFYAPWCPHCNSPNTVKMWTDLADVAQEYFSVGAFNCEDRENGNNRFAEVINIRGYPTIMIVKKNGHLHKYRGERSVPTILNYMCKKYKACAP